MHALLESIDKLLTDRKQKRPWLSDQTGISIHTINGWYQSGRMPRADDAVKVARALGTSVETLVQGSEVKYFDATGREVQPSATDTVLLLPFISQRVSAGPGQELLEDSEIQRHLPVLSSLVDRYPRKQLRVVEVRGDSMTGVHINDGDCVIFVQGLVRSDGIYVITLQGDVMVKRLQFDQVKSRISIMSENPRYPQPQLVQTDSDLLRIEGKVVAWFHLHPY